MQAVGAKPARASIARTHSARPVWRVLTCVTQPEFIGADGPAPLDMYYPWVDQLSYDMFAYHVQIHRLGWRLMARPEGSCCISRSRPIRHHAFSMQLHAVDPPYPAKSLYTEIAHWNLFLPAPRRCEAVHISCGVQRGKYPVVSAAVGIIICLIRQSASRVQAFTHHKLLRRSSLATFAEPGDVGLPACRPCCIAGSLRASKRAASFRLQAAITSTRVACQLALFCIHRAPRCRQVARGRSGIGLPLSSRPGQASEGPT